MPISPTRARALLDALERSVRPRMTRALRRALDALAKSAPLNEMETLLAHGDINGAIGLLLDTGAAPARAILTQGVSEAVIATGHAAFTKGAAGLLIKRSVSSFGLVSTRAAEAVHTVALQFFPPIFQDTETVLRKVFADGLRQGINPRTVAIDARRYVGLTEYDHTIMGTFESALRGGDYTAVMQRTLRDKRFDPALKAARKAGRPLTETQIRDMSTRYGERLLKWRAETWSRSASLNAMRNGEQAAWREAADIAGVAPDQIVKTWSATLDERTREEHYAADGTTVGIDEPYPVDGGVMVPGDGVYNCRCISVFAILPANKEASREFLARPSMQPRAEREATASLRGVTRL